MLVMRPNNQQRSENQSILICRPKQWRSQTKTVSKTTDWKGIPWAELPWRRWSGSGTVSAAGKAAGASRPHAYHRHRRSGHEYRRENSSSPDQTPAHEQVPPANQNNCICCVQTSNNVFSSTFTACTTKLEPAFYRMRFLPVKGLWQYWNKLADKEKSEPLDLKFSWPTTVTTTPIKGHYTGQPALAGSVGYRRILLERSFTACMSLLTATRTIGLGTRHESSHQPRYLHHLVTTFLDPVTTTNIL